MVETYTVTGPDAASATWSLEGARRRRLQNQQRRYAHLQEFPQLRVPADDGADNTYMVTLKADDGTYMDTHDVTVMVTNVEEDGSVTLSPMHR